MIAKVILKPVLKCCNSDARRVYLLAGLLSLFKSTTQLNPKELQEFNNTFQIRCKADALQLPMLTTGVLSSELKDWASRTGEALVNYLMQCLPKWLRYDDQKMRIDLRRLVAYCGLYA